MPTRNTLNVSLTPELESYVREQVEAGGYASASEVVRESLRLHQDRALARAALRAQIEEGRASGPPEPWDPDAMKAATRERMAGLRDEVARGQRPPPTAEGAED